MTYIAYLRQEGEGCDYTIGCGLAIRTLAASSMEQAKVALGELIAEEFSSEERQLESAEIFEVNDIFKFDLNEYYKALWQEREQERIRETEFREKKQYEYLKSKYGL